MQLWFFIFTLFSCKFRKNCTRVDPSGPVRTSQDQSGPAKTSQGPVRISQDQSGYFFLICKLANNFCSGIESASAFQRFGINPDELGRCSKSAKSMLPGLK